MQKIFRQSLNHPYIVIALAASLLALPLFFYIDSTLDDGDLFFYKIALVEFSSQFWHGEFFPRWLYATNDGLGSPVFLFLGAGAYYPSVLFQLLSGIDPEGNIRFALSVWLARIIAGMLCFQWLKSHYSKSEALLISVLFLTIPYSIHEIYVRTELAGQWAFVSIFAIFLSLDATIRSQSGRAVMCFALASASLIFIHLPTFITFGWIPFLYVLCLAPQKLKALAHVVLGNVLAVLLCAVYVLPLWLNKDFINSDHYSGGQYTFAQNFLVHPNEAYCVPYFLLALMAGYDYVQKKWLENKTLAQFHLLTVLVVGFMILPISSIVWQLVFPLHFIQFPFRFLNIALLPFACVGAHFILRGKYEAWVIILWCLGLFTHGYIIAAFAPYDNTGDLKPIMAHKLITLDEYRTSWNKTHAQFIINNTLADKYAKQPVVSAVHSELKILEQGQLGDIQVQVNAQTEDTLLFKRFYFPGMEVRNLTTGETYPIHAEGKEGLLAATIPAGNYTVVARNGLFAGEKQGRIISVCGLLIAAALALNSRNKKA